MRGSYQLKHSYGITVTMLLREDGSNVFRNMERESMCATDSLDFLPSNDVVENQPSGISK